MPRQIFLILAAALLGIAATASAERIEPELRIGAVLHLTGDLAMQSNAFREGLELGIERYASRGVTLVVEDGRNSASSSRTAVQKLLAHDEVSVVILSSYLDAMANGALLEREHVPGLVLWDSSPEIDAIGASVFSIGPWIPSTGEAAAEFARGKLAASRAVIVKSEDPFSDSAAAVFERRFKELGGSVLDTFALSPVESDFRSVLARTKALEPDVLYTPVVSGIVPFYSQMRALRIDVPAISCNAITEEHVRQNPQAFDGIFQTMIADPKGPRLAELSVNYEARYGKPLSMPWYVATGFDAVGILVTAAANSDGTSAGIGRALSVLEGFEGVTRSISIGATGSAPEHERVYRLRNGRFEATDSRRVGEAEPRTPR